MTKSFIQDILPFFYNRRVTYVDVGAHKGEVFLEFLEGGFRIAEAHLVEPNPSSFRVLEAFALEASGKITAKAPSGKVVCHNVAMGADSEATVTMRASGTMTKVVEVDAEKQREQSWTNQDLFEAKVATLDELSKTFVQPHISILKIDVEGFEADVLKGAKTLLASEAVDVIYVEAGFDPDNPQQCYYRIIEDTLKEYGYGVFKIYEQQHEWPTDSPILRRVNMAFMSPSFALSNPHRTSMELFKVRGHLERAEQRLVLLEKEVESSQRREMATCEQLEKRLECLTAQLADTREHLQQAVAKAERQADALSRAEQNARSLGRVVEEKEHLLGLLRAQNKTLRDRLERVRKKRDNAKEALARVQGTYGYRVEKRLAAVGRSAKTALPWTEGVSVPGPLKRWLGVDAPRNSASSKPSDGRQQAKGTPSPKGKPSPQKKEGAKQRRKTSVDETSVEVASAGGQRQPHRTQALIREMDFHACRGDGEHVRRLLLQVGDPEATEVQYALANLNVSSEEDWLRYLNQAFAIGHGLTPLRLEQGDAKRIERLRGSSEPAVDGPKVTIAMSCYNAAEFVDYSMRSLMCQTYRNIEIIVTNDHSDDDTLERLQALAAEDPRIHVRNNTKNVGTYVSRNRAFHEAQGEFFTIMDADDYAHPQRIQTQVEALQRNPGWIGNMTRWVRMTADGTFVFRRAWGGVYEHEAAATLMFRAGTVRDRVGYWDSVRFSADTEFLHRLRTVWGKNAVRTLRKPTMLSLTHPGSLTAHPVTGIDNETGLSPARKAYRKAWQAWHARQGTDLYLPKSQEVRRFEVPEALLVPPSQISTGAGG